MLLPQSSAFAALKNRLNSVSSIGYLHSAPRPYVNLSPTTQTTHTRGGSVAEAVSTYLTPHQGHTPRSKSVHDTHAFSTSSTTTPSSSNYDRPNRLKGREEGPIRWDQLLEKFRSVQDKARRAQRLGGGLDEGPDFSEFRLSDGLGWKDTARTAAPPVPQKETTPAPAAAPPRKSGLGRQFGRLGAVGRGKKTQG